MNNNLLNALVFSEINNNIPINDKRYKNLLKAANITDSGGEARKKKLKELLAYTTIKRAYCMGKDNKENSGMYDEEKKAYKINIKIPFTVGYTASNEEKKLGYRTIDIYVPEALANKKNQGGLIENAFSCDSFYGAYCENMKYLLGIETGEDRASITNPELFNEYAECACYADVPYEIEGMIANVGNVGGGVPPKCYTPNCGEGTKNYLDPVSKTNQCSTVICQSVTQVGDISGSNSGSAAFNQKINQECNKSTSNTKKEEKENEQTTTEKKTESNLKNEKNYKKESTVEDKDSDIDDKSKNFNTTQNYLGGIVLILLCFMCMGLFLAIIMRR